jgi:hypothetical protein
LLNFYVLLQYVACLLAGRWKVARKISGRVSGSLRAAWQIGRQETFALTADGGLLVFTSLLKA